jgi:hypothetical protein
MSRNIIFVIKKRQEWKDLPEWISTNSEHLNMQWEEGYSLVLRKERRCNHFWIAREQLSKYVLFNFAYILVFVYCRHIYRVFREQADWTFILSSELRHLPRKMPPRGTTYWEVWWACTMNTVYFLTANYTAVSKIIILLFVQKIFETKL